MKKRNNNDIRRAWLEVGALTDEQILEAASVLPKALPDIEKATKPKKPRKGKAKK
jgi:hypothetical protein